MANLEKNLEKRLINIIKKLGGKTIKVDPKKYNGFPDRIIFLPKFGRIDYVELKNKTYYQRTHNQIVWADIVIASGGNYYLLDGDDEVNEYIRKLVE